MCNTENLYCQCSLFYYNYSVNEKYETEISHFNCNAVYFSARRKTGITSHELTLIRSFNID